MSRNGVFIDKAIEVLRARGAERSQRFFAFITQVATNDDWLHLDSDKKWPEVRSHILWVGYRRFTVGVALVNEDSACSVKGLVDGVGSPWF